jgi:hypothetical protein
MLLLNVFVQFCYGSRLETVIEQQSHDRSRQQEESAPIKASSQVLDRYILTLSFCHWKQNLWTPKHGNIICEIPTWQHNLWNPNMATDCTSVISMITPPANSTMCTILCLTQRCIIYDIKVSKFKHRRHQKNIVSFRVYKMNKSLSKFEQKRN